MDGERERNGILTFGFRDQTYAIGRMRELHKRSHLWKVDGVRWESVATFRSQQHADDFVAFIERALGPTARKHI